MNVLFLTINITGKRKEIFELDFLKNERTYKTVLFDIFSSPLRYEINYFFEYIAISESPCMNWPLRLLAIVVKTRYTDDVAR